MDAGAVCGCDGRQKVRIVPRGTFVLSSYRIVPRGMVWGEKDEGICGGEGRAKLGYQIGRAKWGVKGWVVVRW